MLNPRAGAIVNERGGSPYFLDTRACTRHQTLGRQRRPPSPPQPTHPPFSIGKRQPSRRIKVLGVQAATDSYIYTFRGFSISRFVECTRAARRHGVNAATPLQITAPGRFVSVRSCGAGLYVPGWKSPGWRVTRNSTHSAASFDRGTRACHFSYALGDLISPPDREWAVSDTYEQRAPKFPTLPASAHPARGDPPLKTRLSRTHRGIRLCHPNQIYLTRRTSPAISTGKFWTNPALFQSDILFFFSFRLEIEELNWKKREAKMTE